MFLPYKKDHKYGLYEGGWCWVWVGLESSRFMYVCTKLFNLFIPYFITMFLVYITFNIKILIFIVPTKIIVRLPLGTFCFFWNYNMLYRIVYLWLTFFVVSLGHSEDLPLCFGYWPSLCIVKVPL
jgi:hypothetical protein